MCSLVGSYPYTTDEIKSMYNEGIKYIFSQSINKASGVCYYNHSSYNDLDVFSFNGKCGILMMNVYRKEVRFGSDRKEKW